MLVDAPLRTFSWEWCLEPGEFATIADLPERVGIARSGTTRRHRRLVRAGTAR